MLVSGRVSYMYYVPFTCPPNLWLGDVSTWQAVSPDEKGRKDANETQDRMPIEKAHSR